MCVGSDVSIGLELFDGAVATAADGTPVPIASRKAFALLSYLALSRHGSESRERLAGLLWSDRGEEQARASLRQCVKQLRTAFDAVGFTGFTSTRTELKIDPLRIRTDLGALKQALAAGDLPPRLLDGSANPERILYGYESLDLSFESWLRLLRKIWHDDLVQSLEEIMGSGRPDAETAERAANALTMIDPTHEEAHRHLIRAHATRGNTSAALDQYKLLWDLLADQYDMEPAAETEALIAAVKSGDFIGDTGRSSPANGTPARAPDATPPTGPASHSPTSQPVIGIASFAQGGAWSQELYLIDGFRRDLISSLVRFREWIVVEVGHGANGGASGGRPSERAADYLMEGAYFEEDGQIHVVITLKDTAASRYIWSEAINLSLDGWFAARRQVVSRVSISLSVYLSAGRLSRIGETPDVSLDIYDRWLRGQGLIYRWQPETHRMAVEIFRRIVDEAPEFSPGYSGMVQLLNSIHIVCPGVYRTAECHQQSLDLAKTAVELDPLDSRAQLCLGWAYAMNGRFEQSVLHHGLARELNGNDIWTLVSAALGLAYAGATGQAMEHADLALKFAPNLTAIQWAYIAGVRYQANDFAGCVEATDRVGEKVPYLLAWKASALAQLGDGAVARATHDRFVELVTRTWSADHPPTVQAVQDWLLHCFPIQYDARRRLRAGLEAAGAAPS